MKNYKKQFIIAGAVLALLCMSFMLNGNATSQNDAVTPPVVSTPVSNNDTTVTTEPTEPVVTAPDAPVTPPKEEVASTPVPTVKKPSEKPKDTYKTDPTPQGKPTPAEPQDSVVVPDKKLSCTISVRCDTILGNIDNLDPEKKELVPEDGIIFASQSVTFYEGESVFNVLQREMKKNKVHMEFANTPIYNSAYIEGIGNLYEFDCGELSGWMYRVNGWFPNYGCSRYQLKEGDNIEWIFTCDLGKDIGGGEVSQKE